MSKIEEGGAHMLKREGSVGKISLGLLLVIILSSCQPTGDVTLKGYSDSLPGVFATVDPITFGAVGVGSPTSQAITLTNNGGADITLGTITNAALQLTSPLQIDAASTCVTAEILKATQSCQIIIAFTAAPVGVYVQTLKLNYHDGGLNHVLSVNISGTAKPVTSNLAPVAFNEDTESTITFSYNAGINVPTCALASLSNLTITQNCACAADVCTVKVIGIANYFGAASFNYTVTANNLVSNSATATLTINSINDNQALTVPSARA
ncbi:MAG: hypothetical protein AABY86_08770, partial [Bdellovibrionota bacterium]